MTGTRKLKRAGWIAFFILPGALIVFVFIVLPLFISLFNSFFNWNQLIRQEYVGLQNFSKLFTTYPYRERFFNALGNNVKWIVITMLVQNTMGLLLGYVLSRGIAGAKVYQRLFFIPVLFSIIAVGYLWGLYLRPNGMVNSLLDAMGLGHVKRAWLGDGSIRSSW